MKKIILAITLIISSFNAFALSETQFARCSAAIKAQVQKANEIVSNLENTSKASDDLLNALSFSIPGTIVSAPSCSALEGLAARYNKIASELSR